jgi:hypothetical protein
MNQQAPNAFEKAQQQKQTGLVKEFLFFLAHNKKFWMIPLLLALFLLAALLILGGTSVAPFIYTLF